MLLDGQDPASVALAAEALARGRLAAFPTETVYGLGARADDDAAVAQIFTAKGRPADHPLIVHVADAAGASVFALDGHIPALAQRLMSAFWPGPVTVIVPRAAGLGAAAAGGQPSIGLRCPSHPVARALLHAAVSLGVPGVAAPSANRFGRISPTRAAHVQQELGHELLVLDGGDCAVGIESCIVDCSRARPVLLRPGVIARAQLEAALGEALVEPDVASPRASGTLDSHYAPRAKLRLMSPVMLTLALEALGAARPEETPGRSQVSSPPRGATTASPLAGGGHEETPGRSRVSSPPRGATTASPLAGGGLKLAVYSRNPAAAGAAQALYRELPSQADAAAHELFSVLRDFDDQGAQLIWVEAPPDTPDWDGVRDRLQRASAA